MTTKVDRRPAAAQAVKSLAAVSSAEVAAKREPDTSRPQGRVIKFDSVRTPKGLADAPVVGRPRGRPPTNPVRIKPMITSKDILSADRLVEPIHSRPLIWKDLPKFAARHSRSSMEMMYDLGFNTTFQYTRAANKAEVVPFDLELLIRILDAYPSSCQWKKTTPSQALDLIYGDMLTPYVDMPEEDAVMRMVMGHRLAAILDRSVTVLYRWLTDAGASSRRVINILSKAEAMGNDPESRRTAFEGIALPAWRLRGIDIDQMFKLTPLTVQSRHMNSEVRQRLLDAKQPVVFQSGMGSFL